jgi:hypothetical protein
MKMTYNEEMRKCVNQTDTLTNSIDATIINMQKNRQQKRESPIS